MGIEHITLVTQDLQRSRNFYSKSLNWEPIDRPGNIGARAAWLQISRDQELHLLEIAGYKPTPHEAEYGRHIAISFPQSEFDTLKRRLIEYGGELIQPTRETSFQRFFFRDPDGHVFEIVDSERNSTE